MSFLKWTNKNYINRNLLCVGRSNGSTSCFHNNKVVLMKKGLGVFSLLAMLFSSPATMAVEEAKYTVLLQEVKIELRQYDSHVLAETIIQGELEDAGNAAFEPLFNYISGNNTTQTDIAMTAPVSQQATSEKIAMTAPVSQQKADNGWAISFMMPASLTLDALPKPNNAKVKLRAVPERLIASIRYSGFWSEENYLEHKLALESWIQQSNYQVNGEAVWARYNAPFMPWFLRRNEVLIPVIETNTD